MDFEKIIVKVRDGKAARISGTPAELKKARTQIEPLINAELAIERNRNCLYVFKALKVSFLPVSSVPRQ